MSTTIPALSDVTDILDTDLVMITHSNGQSYKIAGSELNKRNQVVIATGTTITGTPLKTGNVVRVYFTAALSAANGSTALVLKYNNVNYTVKVPKNGALQNYVAFDIGGGTYKYLQAYTTLELIYDGTNFVILGTPVVLSDTDYTIYADGKKTNQMMSKGDANQCIPEGGNYQIYSVGASGSNLPNNNNFTIESFCYKAPSPSLALRLRQIASSGNSLFIRAAGSNDNGSTWTFDDWLKLVQDTDVNPSWVDTGIISGSKGFIHYKKIGSLVALNIISTEGSLKFTESGGAMKKIVGNVETIIYLPEEIRPASTKAVNFALIDNTFDTVFHGRINPSGTITAWNNTLKYVQDVNSWVLDIVYSI